MAQLSSLRVRDITYDFSPPLDIPPDIYPTSPEEAVAYDMAYRDQPPTRDKRSLMADSVAGVLSGFILGQTVGARNPEHRAELISVFAKGNPVVFAFQEVASL